MTNNIAKVRKENGMNQERLAELLGVKRAAVSKYENGSLPLNADTLSKLADHFNVSVDYLLGRTDDRNGTAVQTNKNSPAEIDEATLRKAGFFPATLGRVPLIGSIACGDPKLALQDATEFVTVLGDHGADFALRAEGDSMIGVNIHEGDTVLVKAQNTVDDGDIAVVLVGEDATLKRVRFLNDIQSIMLIPENPDMEPKVYPITELDDIRIIGKALWVERSLQNSGEGWL